MKEDINKLTNPIGTAKKDLVEIKIVALKCQWSEMLDEVKNNKIWWKIWNSNKVSLYKSVKFLISSLDELINYVDAVVDNGPDKKATVIAAITIIYDFVMMGVMPLWL